MGGTSSVPPHSLTVRPTALITAMTNILIPTTLALALAVPCFVTGCATPASDAHVASDAPQASEARDGDAIDRGWAELERGRAIEAGHCFDEALRQDERSTEARVGLIRSWIEQGRVNDSFDALDKLDRDAYAPASLDYLYGMAFARKAHLFVQQDVPPQMLQMAWADAATSLSKATRAEPDAHADAYLPLSEATWYLQDLDAARAAADRASELQPSSAEAAFQLGRVALSQYKTARDEGVANEIADEHWNVAADAFRAASAIAARTMADGAAAASMRARAEVELGHTLAWKQMSSEAAREYAVAMETKPSEVDFQAVRSVLSPEAFATAVDSALRRAEARATTPTSDKALLTWWSGYARFETRQYAEADAAFGKAVELEPSFVNSWFYCALARYYQQDYAGAVSAFVRNWNDGPTELVAAVQTNPELNLAILDYCVAWCTRAERTLDAGVLSEIQAEAAPDQAGYWNNAGLFYRDVGEKLRESGQPKDLELARDLFERAYSAYLRALALLPDDPAILNDTGVMLHYCLERDYDKARELYRRAHERAEQALQSGTLSPELKDLYETALRDSRNNLERLARVEKETD